METQIKRQAEFDLLDFLFKDDITELYKMLAEIDAQLNLDKREIDPVIDDEALQDELSNEEQPQDEQEVDEQLGNENLEPLHSPESELDEIHDNENLQD